MTTEAYEDYRLSPCGHLGGQTAVEQAGRFIGAYSCTTEALTAVREDMETEQFWPDVWWVSDHGNSWPIDSETGEEIEGP